MTNTGLPWLVHTQQFDHLKEGKQVANRCSGSWLWQQERGFRHRINLISAPLSTGPSDGFLPLAWRFKLLWNHKSKETIFFTGGRVRKTGSDQQWCPWSKLPLCRHRRQTVICLIEKLRVRDTTVKERETGGAGGPLIFWRSTTRTRPDARTHYSQLHTEALKRFSFIHEFFFLIQFLDFVFIEETCWLRIDEAETST